MTRLPSELLLHVASYLRVEKPSQLANLRNLCLVSRKLLPVAQEVLYANAILPASCNCHPTVNAALQLLRTLLEQPKLAAHVKSLHFAVVRRDIRKLYIVEFHKTQFDLPALLKLSLPKLAEFGYSHEHPWSASLKNSVESAYVGLLLCILPNLTNLHFAIKELHRGHGVVDSIAALFGTNLPPATLGLDKTLSELWLSDLSFLRSMAFENLKILNITSVAVPTLLQLNGPDTFRGTGQLSELSIGLSVFLMDQSCVDEMTVSFRDLIDALGCHSLSTLKIKLEHETYCTYHNPPVFDVQFLMEQLSSVESSLKVLAIDLDTQEDPSEWKFILDNCRHQLSSLTNFTNLELLKIPQDFFLPIRQNEARTLLEDFPQHLRTLEIVCPSRMIFGWVDDSEISVTVPQNIQKLRKIILHCRGDVRTPASVFKKRVHSLWATLDKNCHIASYIHDIDDNVTKNLAKLNDDDESSSEDDDDAYQGHFNSYASERDSESDEDMPALEHFDFQDPSSSAIVSVD